MAFFATLIKIKRPILYHQIKKSVSFVRKWILIIIALQNRWIN